MPVSNGWQSQWTQERFSLWSSVLPGQSYALKAGSDYGSDSRRWVYELKYELKSRCSLYQTAAQILKTEFAASRVVVFGSLLGESFHETSDLDLAVWGLPEKSYFKAVSRLVALSAFAVDLVEVQYAKPELLAAIAQGLKL